MSSDILRRLEAWYLEQCDEDWEHDYGVTIGTLDNPGWTVEIDLVGTCLENRPFTEVGKDYEGEPEWMICRVNGMVFEGACGPRQLSEVLEVFLKWADETRAPLN